MHRISLIGLMLVVTNGFPQVSTPCDPTFDPTPIHGAIFGYEIYPWQRCGDTIRIDERAFVYSYASCRIWPENITGRKRWDIHLSRFDACKLRTIYAIDKEDLPRSMRAYRLIMQVIDHRILLVNTRNGNVRHMSPDDLDAMRRKVESKR